MSMRMALAPVLLLCVLSVSAEDPPRPRFDGDAGLQPALPASSDGRFALRAELRPAAGKNIDGRFSLRASLKPNRDARALATACAGATPNIFSNGFEN